MAGHEACLPIQTLENVVSSSVIFMLMLVAGSCESTITAEKVSDRLAKEVPVGSSVDKVIRFLDAEKIEHSGVLEHPENESDFKELRLDNSAVKTFVVAIIRDVERSGLTKWDLQMHFYFDVHGVLVRNSVKKLGTSL